MHRLNVAVAILATITYVVLATISLGQAGDAMSGQFKTQARIAFRTIEHLDPDDRVLQSQPAHRAVNGLVNIIKTPTISMSMTSCSPGWLRSKKDARRHKTHPALMDAMDEGPGRVDRGLLGRVRDSCQNEVTLTNAFR